MVVLLGSALASNRNRTKKVFQRKSWVDAWPTSEVLIFADPVIHAFPEVDGAYYMHPEHDVLEAIGQISWKVAAQRRIKTARTIFYGSSYGGFAALSAAAHMPGARAVAELPQIDMPEWRSKHRTEIEQTITGPLDAHRLVHPEQVSLYARFKKANRVPQFRIITNTEDIRYQEHLYFFHWADKTRIPKPAKRELIVTTEVRKHKALEKESATKMVDP